MKILTYILFTLGFLMCSAVAGQLPYDDGADANKQVEQAFTLAEQSGKRVLLVFGANWCPDCRVFDQELSKGKIAALVKDNFVTVKIDIGNWDNNLDVVEQYDNPIVKGIPAIVSAASNGDVLYASRAGELANARSMGKDAIMAFFQKILFPSAAR